MQNEGTQMYGPEWVPFRRLRFANGPFFYLKLGLGIDRIFAKCLIFNELGLWFTCRLLKSTYARKYTW